MGTTGNMHAFIRYRLFLSSTPDHLAPPLAAPFRSLEQPRAARKNFWREDTFYCLVWTMVNVTRKQTSFQHPTILYSYTYPLIFVLFHTKPTMQYFVIGLLCLTLSMVCIRLFGILDSISSIPSLFSFGSLRLKDTCPMSSFLDNGNTETKFWRHRHQNNDTLIENAEAIATPAMNYNQSLFLYPGELPGYTGWVRPDYTLAGEFEITMMTASSSQSLKTPRANVGKEWTILVTCHHIECTHGGAHFFVRAYGPAVITGQVHDLNNGSYQIIFLPLDVGLYTVEVILVTSKSPPWESYPLDNNIDNHDYNPHPIMDDPLYEGFMLPNFPISIYVINEKRRKRTSHNDQRSVNQIRQNMNGNNLCSFDQLTEFDSAGAYRKARWVPVKKVTSRSHQQQILKQGPSSNTSQRTTLHGYQTTHNSLGVMMDYIPTNCSLISSQLLHTPAPTNPIDRCFGDNRTTMTSNQVHVIFIGDSVTRMQSNYFETLVHHTNIRTTLISTKGGIVETLQHVKKELNQLLLDETRVSSSTNSSESEHRFIMFNTGLHDIARLCSQKWKKYRSKFLVQHYHDGSLLSPNFSCVDEYEKFFQKLVDFIQLYPADLRVFQSTTAGWPRYGNYGVGWSPQEPQLFSLSSNFVFHFNEIAYDIVSKVPEIHIMDGYWITLARPDNREMKESNTVGSHLVHPGLEVMNAMGRIWWMILTRTICNDALDDIVNEVEAHVNVNSA